ncbi:hypothetical protein [Actinokineospora sp.]|uniref:hypothetical protein n=1 Tax=Actinokineospora sp. TaxID=1872133 RepID=UPI0040383932
MIRVAETDLIAQITGHESINGTAQRYGIHATDLGIMWDDGAGRTFVAIARTLQRQSAPSLGPWRAWNFLAGDHRLDAQAGVEVAVGGRAVAAPAAAVGVAEDDVLLRPRRRLRLPVRHGHRRVPRRWPHLGQARSPAQYS